MTFQDKIKNAINYKVTKASESRSRVKVTFQTTRRTYRDPYDSSKGIRTQIIDKDKDMFMTKEQIRIIDAMTSGREI